MPRHHRTPNADDVLRQHSQRLYRIERDTTPEEGAAPLREVVFSFFGPLELSTSPRWSHPDGALLVSVLAQLDTPGTGTTEVRVRKNGTTVATITLGAGDVRGEDLLGGVRCSREDYLQAQVVDVGGDAASLTVQARFR